MKAMYVYKIGDKVDDLICIGIIPPENGNSTKYIMECIKCHRHKHMFGATLARHCGTTHQACGKGLKLKNKEFYEKWQSMRSRTTNPKTEHYKDYGGRGINSDEFKNFIDFYDTMYTSYLEAVNRYGVRNVSLERNDVNGNYCKDNCCWIHISDQHSNTRDTVYFEITFPNGDVKEFRNVNKFCREYELNASCVRDLIGGKLKVYRGLHGRRISG